MSHAEGMPRGAVWAGLAGTTLLHATALLVLLVGVARQPRAFPPTYAVQLVAAPAATASVRPAAPRAAPEVPPAAKPQPKAPAAKPTSRSQQRTAPKTTAPVTPLPGARPNTGSDIENVDLKGKAFPYPEYLRNLVTQIYRRWNRPADNSPLTAEVGFIILRDGTVRDIQVVASSRSYSFDQEALGAVESAALVKAFGPLPPGYQADYLQVSFTFAPRP